MGMSAAAIAAIIGSAAIGAGGSIIGGAQAAGGSTGFRASNYDPLLALENKFRPIDFSAGLQQLVGQSAYGLGADPNAIAMELLIRQVEATSNPAEARKIQRHLQSLQNLTAIQKQLGPAGLLEKPITVLGQTYKPASIAAQIEKTQMQLNNLLAKRGVGTVAFDQSGRLQITLNDPSLQQIVDRARTEGEAIRNNRLLAEQNLSRITADFPTASASDLQKLIAEERVRQEREINQRYQLETDRILTQANTSGYNPAGTLGELEKQRTEDLFDTNRTATDYALQILGGKQNLATQSIAGIGLGLSPDREIAIMNALRGQQSATTGQLAAAQAQANAQGNIANAQSQGSGIASGAQSISDLGTLLALLGSKGPATTSGAAK